MMRPPRFARAVLRLVLPRHEISDALEGDLREGFVSRAAESPARARWWYRGQVLVLPYPSLRREIARLRRADDVARLHGGGAGMGGVLMDLRIAMRSLARRPSFTGVALVTLAVSVGAATLLFSVVEGVLLRPLPYDEPGGLVTVYLTSDEWRTSDNEMLRASWDVQTMGLEHAAAFRETPGPIVSAGAYTYQRLPLETADGVEEVAEVIYADRETFDVLGVRPNLGRLPTPDEITRSEPVALLRHETWSERFGRDPDVLGRTFRLGELAYTVVGVMPPGFFFPTDDGSDLWAPPTGDARDWAMYYGVARLAPGASVAEASDFFEVVARRLGESDPSNAGRGGRAVPHLDSVVGSVQGGIRLLFGTALLVVLVACANLGTLFLARTAGRREELAVRMSLGAGAASLVSTVVAEVVVLGVVGGGLGVLLAAVALEPFVGALGASLRNLPRQATIGLDPTVLLFSLGATLLTVLAAGLGPVLASSAHAPGRVIGHGRRAGASDATRRGQRLLLGMQGAVTVVLFSAAALLGRSFYAAMSVDTGMATEGVAVLEIGVDEDRIAADADLNALYDAVRDRVAGVSGVASVGITTTLPGQGGILLARLRAPGSDPNETASIISIAVGEGYFASTGIPLVDGRGFGPADASDEVWETVVSESLAAQLFGRSDVVGRELLMGRDDARSLRIVGVVGETRQISVFQPPAATFYHPMQYRPRAHAYVTIATEGDRGPVLDAARDAVLALDPRVEVRSASGLDAMLLDTMRHIRLRMILMAALAVLAGGLAMIGISGVVAHFLSEQTRDVGIRMALGAGARGEIGRVVGQAMWPTLAGVVVGALVARGASGLVTDQVFGVEPSDPVTYVAVAALLVGTALLAAWIPARRTAGVDPARVLNRDG